MTTTQKKNSHFYELLRNRVITLLQFRHIAKVLSGNGKFQRSLFNDEQFKACIEALKAHAKQDSLAQDKYLVYSFGKNEKFPNYIGIVPELAGLMEDEEIRLYNRKIRRNEDTITTRAIKNAYRFGALQIDSSMVDLSGLPTLEVNGVMVRVALIPQN
jgi:hypothetical protein